MHLATLQQADLRGGKIGCGIVGVDLAPRFQWGAVIRVRRHDGGLGAGRDVGVDPLPEAAVEVPVVVLAKEGAVALAGDGVEGRLSDPGLDQGVVGRQAQVPGHDHFLPHDGTHAGGSNVGVEVVDKGLEVGLDDLGVVGANVRV